jgi:hypothetical protein
LHPALGAHFRRRLDTDSDEKYGAVVLGLECEVDVHVHIANHTELLGGGDETWGVVGNGGFFQNGKGLVKDHAGSLFVFECE